MGIIMMQMGTGLLLFRSPINTSWMIRSSIANPMGMVYEIANYTGT